MRLTLSSTPGAWVVTAALVSCATQAPPPESPPPATGHTAGPSTAATLGIPPGKLPSPGECRIWYPGTPPGHQPKPGDCTAIEATAPPGSWIVYRPTTDKKLVYVREVDPHRTGVVVKVQVFDAASGAFVRDVTP